MNHHQRLLDASLGQQHCLHFFRLDTEAADLHLLVEAAKVFQRLMSGVPARPVATAVQALAVAVRVWQEAFGGQAGTAQVTPGQARAAQVQLAGNAGRGGLQVVIEHAAEHVGQGSTDR